MTATFHVGDAIETMNKLPENSVDLILTSPPFLALRSYLPADHPDKALEGGSQATPGAFIDWLVDVVEACDRVLAPHGSMCIELGDTYAGSGGGGGDYLEGGWREGQAQFAGSAASMKESNAAHWRQKNSNASAWSLAKSLSLIPELFRLTLVYGTNPLTGRQTDRWRLRNVVRWVRPNPPVGALGDKFRPATSELMVFCKSAKRYFDLDAVREPHQANSLERDKYVRPVSSMAAGLRGGDSDRWDGVWKSPMNPSGAPPLDWWKIPQGSHLRHPCEHGRYERHRIHEYDLSFCPGGEYVETSGAPPLDWWNIPPGGFSGAHYAVFPPELCIKPIKAMCPEKVCRQCGEPSRRIEGETRFIDRRGVDVTGQSIPGRSYEGNKPVPRQPGSNWGRIKTTETLGFSDCGCRIPCQTCDGEGRIFHGGTHAEWGPCPTCQGEGSVSNWRPGVVLDPFGGSGTTALVATGHGRDCILIDLDERNFALALERVGPFLLERAS